MSTVAEIYTPSFDEGHSVTLRYISPNTGGRILFNFKAGEDIALHVNPRYQHGVLVLNSKIDGSWGSEEKPSGFPFGSDEEIYITVTAGSEAFEIRAGVGDEERFAYDYHYRVPVALVDQIEVMFTDGAEDSAQLLSLTSTEPGLVLYWPLNGIEVDQVLDASGNGLKGTLGGNPQLVSDERFGTCLSFSGNAEDRVELSNFSSFPTDAITVICWINSSDDSRAAAPISYATVDGKWGNEFCIFDIGGVQPCIGSQDGKKTGVSFNDGSWHHLAATWQSSDGAFTLYKDGQPVVNQTIKAGYSLGTGGTLELAQEQDTVGGGFDANQALNGKMAHFRIYNRVLSEEDINRIMNSDPLVTLAAGNSSGG
jgi:hypothetical protein